MRFVNKYIDKIYKYLYIHDGETLLMKDMERELNITVKTIRKYLRWLVRREYIKKDGKKISILPQ